MKKFYMGLLSFIVVPAYAGPFGDVMANGGYPKYLADAANAWASVAIAGTSGSAVNARRLNETFAADLPLFANLMTVTAYNNSALTMFEVIQHIDNSFYPINKPLSSPRTGCDWINGKCDVRKQALILDMYVFGGFTDYDSEMNGSFDTKRSGVNISASGFVSESMVLGVGFTRTSADTNDEIIFEDIVSSSFTAFAKYLSKNGMFADAGFTYGHTNWDIEKSIASINNSSDYDTNFYAGEINGGIKFESGAIFFTPKIGARYLSMTTDKHTDTVFQNFDKWSRSALTGMGEFRFGANIITSDITFLPSVIIGAGYDVATNGDELVRVTLVNNSDYLIPIEVPDPFAFNTGLELAISAYMFEASLGYKLDARQNFMAHNIFFNLKLSF